MLERFNAFLWGVPVLGLILGTGVWLTVRVGFPQVRLFPRACREFVRRLRDRDSGFRALCTALAATVGTGNIAGVAGAIAIGGPGAVLWMWVSAFLGMAVKFAESTLAVRYREPDGRAGPMYIITKGLGDRGRWMASLYCIFGILASFGVGNAAQVEPVLSSLRTTGVSEGFTLFLGFALALIVARMVMGGAKAITGAAELLVPVVSGAYILLCLVGIGLNWDRVGAAFGSIFRGALDPAAVTGGAVGTMMTTLRLGVSRGTFTNEAGMGTAAIAHGGAEGVEPVQQGMMGLMEVFLDTVVICTLTALVLLTSGVQVPYGENAGAELTALALERTFGGWVCAFLSGCMVLFALGAILGWSFYAGRCVEFLFGRVNWRLFGFLEGAVVLAGVFLGSGTVWTLAEIANGLLALPNLAALLMLCGETARLTKGRGMCYNRSHRQMKRGNPHERQGNRRAPSAHPPGPQQYDRHPRLLRQRGQGGHQQIQTFHRHDAGE